jgi:hypothetical protein
MATESSSQKGRIETSVQLLRRLEQHDWEHSRSDEYHEWRSGRDDWDEIKAGARSVPNGAIITKHYQIARKYAYYGHE